MAPSDQWRQEGGSLVRDLQLDDLKAAMAFVNPVNGLSDASAASLHADPARARRPPSK